MSVHPPQGSAHPALAAHLEEEQLRLTRQILALTEEVLGRTGGRRER